MALHQRTFTTVGAQYTGGERARYLIECAITRLRWKRLPLETGMMAGLGINAAIEQLRLPKVTHVAVSNDLAPYGFYGITAHYKNGAARVYLVDSGTGVTPVCSDFWEGQPEPFEPSPVRDHYPDAEPFKAAMAEVQK